MKNRAYLILAVLFLIPLGCATFPQGDPAQSSSLTMGMIKKEIIKGSTTQAEILQKFGSPNLVTKNRSNDEVWNYNRMSYESKTGADGASFIFFGGSRAMSSTTSKSFDLMITFDEKDVVKDYSVISAQY